MKSQELLRLLAVTLSGDVSFPAALEALVLRLVCHLERAVFSKVVLGGADVALVRIRVLTRRRESLSDIGSRRGLLLLIGPLYVALIVGVVSLQICPVEAVDGGFCGLDVVVVHKGVLLLEVNLARSELLEEVLHLVLSDLHVQVAYEQRH